MCKYNNSLYSTNIPEMEVTYDHIEEILFMDDYEAQEYTDARLNEEYQQVQVYEMNHNEMLNFINLAEEYYEGE